jgi:alpha-1,2-mannosyltransferase
MMPASLMERPDFAAAVFLSVLALVVVVNFTGAALMHGAGVQTGAWDLHFWALWAIGHAPSWMPVDDSWMPMRKAYEWVSHPHHGTLYREVFFDQHVKFQYPPSSLLVFAIPDALHMPVTNRVLNWIGWLAVPAEAIATGAIAFETARGAAWARQSPHMHLACAIAAGLAVFSFHSVLWAFSLGQIQAWVNAWFAFAALAWLTGRERASGALIGLICLFKPQFGLFVIWAALRGRGRFLVGAVIVIAMGLGLSLAWFGFANHVDYLAALSFMNQHGEAYYPNASVNGVMNRLLSNDDPFIVDKEAFPSFHPLTYYISVAMSLAFLAIALFVRRKRAGVAEFMAAAILFTIASPIAWTHHLGILPPVFAFLAVFLVNRGQGVGAAVALAAAYLMSAFFVPPVPAFAGGVASLVYALPLAGALICTAMLLATTPADRKQYGPT